MYVSSTLTHTVVPSFYFITSKNLYLFGAVGSPGSGTSLVLDVDNFSRRHR